ncbi:MAG TPA: hypothetical protein VEC39_14900 [Vicinamibacterales bacterium]|nr:hypothetical protein [Vicinamibacterales bacterium]
MLEELTMLATMPVDPAAVKKAVDLDYRAQQPDVPHPVPGLPKTPEQPVVPPDDPHRPDVEREPSIDPPPGEPPVQLPSEKPGITEPPRPRA